MIRKAIMRMLRENPVDSAWNGFFETVLCLCVCSDIKRTALARVVSKLRQIKALSDR